jgi:D-alanyl-D-alanine dipeptidase
LPIFDPKNCYNPLPPPLLSRFISAGQFSVPHVEMKLKGPHFADVAEIQKDVTDELKKAQKKNFR